MTLRPVAGDEYTSLPSFVFTHVNMISCSTVFF
jgi:hypothetical protein